MPREAALTEGSLPDPTAIFERIPESACLVEFFVHEKNIFTFVLARSGFLQMTVVQTGDLDVGAFVEKCRVELEEDDDSVTNVGLLFPLLFREIWNSIKDFKQLIVAPHGPLNRVPFAALWLQNETKATVPLCQRFTVITIPSAATMLSWGHEQRPYDTSRASLVMGNPTEDLKGSEKDALAVARLLRTKPLLRRDATAASLVALAGQRVGVIHIASHGDLDANDPLLSGIGLADRSFTVEDLLGLRLDADLLVLSGCFTGPPTFGQEMSWWDWCERPTSPAFEP